MRKSDISKVAARAARAPKPTVSNRFALPDPDDESHLLARIAIIKSQHAAIRGDLRAEALLLGFLLHLVDHMADSDSAANPAANGVSVIKGLTLGKTLAALELMRPLTGKSFGDGFALGRWEVLTRATRLNMQQLALESHDWRSFTLHFTDEVERCSRDHERGPADYLRQRLAQQIKRDFGEPASFWFKIERFTRSRRGRPSDHNAPHLHGSIRVPSGISDIELAATLRHVGGHPRKSPPGRPPAELKIPEHANAGLGWVIYTLKTAYLDDVPAGVPVPDYLRNLRSRCWFTLNDTVAVTQNLQTSGRLLYGRLRMFVSEYNAPVMLTASRAVLIAP